MDPIYESYARTARINGRDNINQTKTSLQTKIIKFLNKSPMNDAGGYTDKEIAKALNTSEKEVDDAIMGIMRMDQKTGVKPEINMWANQKNSKGDLVNFSVAQAKADKYWKVKYGK